MNEKIQRFYEAVSADEGLQAELGAAVEGVELEGVSEEEARAAIAEVVAAFSAEHDLDLTVEDILAADAEAVEGQLSEGELEAVAGGSSGCACVIIGMFRGCGCFIGGAAKTQGVTGGEYTACPIMVGL